MSNKNESGFEKGLKVAGAVISVATAVVGALSGLKK